MLHIARFRIFEHVPHLWTPRPTSLMSFTAANFSISLSAAITSRECNNAEIRSFDWLPSLGRNGWMLELLNQIWRLEYFLTIELHHKNWVETRLSERKQRNFKIHPLERKSTYSMGRVTNYIIQNEYKIQRSIYLSWQLLKRKIRIHLNVINYKGVLIFLYMKWNFTYICIYSIYIILILFIIYNY